MSKLIDQLGRKIDYLRISITDRCNLRCQYCMPEGGVNQIKHQEILRYEELIKVVRVAARLGVKKIRLTGGDPLVRKGVVDFVRMLKEIEGIEEVSLTTNGILLEEKGEALVEAGLDRVNISLDTLQRDKFREITRVGEFEQVWRGIEEALRLELAPIKINTVLMRGVNDDEIFDFIDLTREYPLHVRFIEFMPMGGKKLEQEEKYMSIENLKRKIKGKEQLLPSQFATGNGPAYYYQVREGLGTVGFISPISNHFCSSCNRIRLTATGWLRPCLCSDDEINLKELIRNNSSEEKLAARFMEAIGYKPDQHQLGQEDNLAKHMSQIGG
ncbi:GTP 3',8-cyclase MoaA [Natroniella sulfidigena]|uniref:GTP 3',8-cyclase MoaA n=1 Tax=Natroniella sulfidigena TaxID=723921 RepID=UPI00200A9C23|nr:GTP 3',8-cyclase MoaA [Natroniella sulfidigena]MCK8816087.1 GTP 3',8-cyclase MoaA [Natroniella sulfidigena]